MEVPVQLTNLKEHFSELADPRQARGKRHELVDILLIMLLAMICGADNAEEIEEYGECHEAWLRTFLRLPHGTPTQDTYLRVLAAVEPTAFQERFQGWVASQLSPAAHVAIDGKTVRGSFDRDSGATAIHMVSAWLEGAGLVLRQVKMSEKSNEIKAIPELLKLLDLKGVVVTTDAIGCQRAIASQIYEKGAILRSVGQGEPADTLQWTSRGSFWTQTGHSGQRRSLPPK